MSVYESTVPPTAKASELRAALVHEIAVLFPEIEELLITRAITVTLIPDNGTWHVSIRTLIGG